MGRGLGASWKVVPLVGRPGETLLVFAFTTMIVSRAKFFELLQTGSIKGTSPLVALVLLITSGIIRYVWLITSGSGAHHSAAETETERFGLRCYKGLHNPL